MKNLVDKYTRMNFFPTKPVKIKARIFSYYLLLLCYRTLGLNKEIEQCLSEFNAFVNEFPSEDGHDFLRYYYLHCKRFADSNRHASKSVALNKKAIGITVIPTIPDLSTVPVTQAVKSESAPLVLSEKGYEDNGLFGDTHKRKLTLSGQPVTQQSDREQLDRAQSDQEKLKKQRPDEIHNKGNIGVTRSDNPPKDYDNGSRNVMQM